MKILLLYLTCANQVEADAITKRLLECKLIACAKQMPIKASFIWNGSIEESTEILILMDTIESKLTAIENEIKKLHSYQTFVLTGVEAVYVSMEAKKWIQEVINQRELPCQ